MSSRTSSRSTLTTVPSTMSPSLKYLMVSSMAARKASSVPRSSTVTLVPLGAAGALEVASMLLVMWVVAPVGWISGGDLLCSRGLSPGTPRNRLRFRAVLTTAGLLPAETRDPRVHRTAYRAQYHTVQPSPTPVAGFCLIYVPTMSEPGVARRAVTSGENRRASRHWWDDDADAYQGEHGEFLGDVDFVWCPEGLREADAHLLGEVAGTRILELGCGA